MKKISFLIFTLVLSLIFVSCSKDVTYRDNLTCSAISSEICDEAEVLGGYSAYEKDHVAFLFENTALYDDCAILYSTEVTDINEIGVFHCKNNDDAKNLTETVSKYIRDMQTEQKSFIESYAPREVPKLENAEVRQYGNYVIYLIISADDKEDATEKIGELLIK